MSFQNLYFDFLSWFKVPRLMVQGAPKVGQVEPMKQINWNVIFILSERLSSSYFMPVCYLVQQLSFAIQKKFSSILTWQRLKKEKVVQGTPLSPTLSNINTELTSPACIFPQPYLFSVLYWGRVYSHCITGKDKCLWVFVVNKVFVFIFYSAEWNESYHTSCRIWPTH